jgi:hypothetical protein
MWLEKPSLSLFSGHTAKTKELVEISIVPAHMNQEVLSGTSSAASTLACAYVLFANLAHTDDLATTSSDFKYTGVENDNTSFKHTIFASSKNKKKEELSVSLSVFALKVL